MNSLIIIDAIPDSDTTARAGVSARRCRVLHISSALLISGRRTPIKHQATAFGLLGLRTPSLVFELSYMVHRLI
jgi:hypothetical protein